MKGMGGMGAQGGMKKGKKSEGNGSMMMDQKTMEKVCSGQDMKPEEMMKGMKRGKK